MNDFEGFRGGKKPPVPEGSADAFHDFIRWLEEHNYCKVTPCIRCYFWGSNADKRYQEPAKHCRRHDYVLTWPDDYCSDAVEVKHEN